MSKEKKQYIPLVTSVEAAELLDLDNPAHFNRIKMRKDFPEALGIYQGKLYWEQATIIKYKSKVIIAVTRDNKQLVAELWAKGMGVQQIHYKTKLSQATIKTYIIWAKHEYVKTEHGGLGKALLLMPGARRNTK